MSQFYHIGGVFPGRHWSSLVVIGCHWQSSVFRCTCKKWAIGLGLGYSLQYSRVGLSNGTLYGTVLCYY